MTTAAETIDPDRIWSEFDGTSGGRSLPNLCGELSAQQLYSWQEFAVAHMELNSAWLREFPFGPHPLLVQYNPGRTVSAVAAVDGETIRKRACFLCEFRLPPSQKAILYRQEWLLLVNPHPIFSPHYTVAHLDHRPQELTGHTGALLRLAEDLGPAFTVFYNGPLCGASAPDHHHFQVSPSGTIPIEGIEREISEAPIVSREGVSLYMLRLPGRDLFLVEGEEWDAVEALLTDLIYEMRLILGGSEEPPLNLLCTKREKGWRIFLFPRRKHRPDAYFREGEAGILVTPGAVEMGGLLITIREGDFLKLTPTLAEDIYREVGAERAFLEEVVKRI